MVQMNLPAMVPPMPPLFSRTLVAAADAARGAARRPRGRLGMEYSPLMMMNMPGVKMRSALSGAG